MNAADLAMLLEAHVAREADPLTRFVNSLPPELKEFAEGTIRLRKELLSNVQRMFTAADAREANAHAEWVSRHAHEAAYRWAGLMASVRRWCELDTQSLVLRASAEDR